MTARRPLLAAGRIGRLLSGVLLVTTSAAVAGQESFPESLDVVSTADRRALSLPALARELARTDVLVLASRLDPSAPRRAEAAVTAAIGAAGRAVVLVLDALPASAQEPLDHFLMSHLSDREFTADTGVSPAIIAALKPLVQVAIDRSWPALAAGGVPGDNRETRTAAIANAVTTAEAIARAGGNGSLIVIVSSEPATSDDGLATAIRAPGRRVVSLAILPASAASDASRTAASDYVVVAP